MEQKLGSSPPLPLQHADGICTCAGEALAWDRLPEEKEPRTSNTNTSQNRSAVEGYETQALCQDS